MSNAPFPTASQLKNLSQVFRSGEVSARTFNDVVWRFSSLHFAKSHHFMSGLGSLMAGGRFNFVGAFPAAYASLDVATATAEMMQALANVAIGNFAGKSQVLAGVHVRLQRVLDLTDAETRSILQVTADDLAVDWKSSQLRGHEALTQVIGREGRDAGFEAILAPSAQRAEGCNLVVFPDRLIAGSTIVHGQLLDTI